jgi:hypothetical protein
MAQTSRKRRTKHRGNAAGVVEARGRTGRPPSPEEKKKASKDAARQKRLNTPPTWSSALTKGGVASGLLFVFILLTSHSKSGSPVLTAVLLAGLALLIYVPAGYYLEMWMYRRRMAKQNPPLKR